MTLKFDEVLETTVLAMLENNITPALFGEPGIGKSAWLRNLAEKQGTKCFTLACNQLADKADMTGARTVQDPDTKEWKQVFFPHEVFADVNAYAKKHKKQFPLLFIDEWNRPSADITGGVMSVVTDRKLGGMELEPNIRIVIAGNDKGNIASLDTASISRTALLFVQPDVPTYIRVNPNLHPTIKDVLVKNNDLIFCKKLNTQQQSNDDDLYDFEESLEQFTTPRTITYLSDWLNTMDNKTLLALYNSPTDTKYGSYNILSEIVFGMVGYTEFALTLLNELPQVLQQVSPIAKPTAITVGKPPIVDELRSASTRKEIEELLTNSDFEEKSNVLLFCLHDTEDNSHIIPPVMSSLPEADADGNVQYMEKTVMSKFIQLAQSGHLDEDNLQVAKKQQTPFGNFINTIA